MPTWIKTAEQGKIKFGYDQKLNFEGQVIAPLCFARSDPLRRK